MSRAEKTPGITRSLLISAIPPESDQSARRWRFPFGWLSLILLAWVVYELTHSPALGSVLVCLKFGWEDALTARWLWLNDTQRWRRSATFWLYLSWGLWKVALVAFLMSIAFASLTPPAAGLRAFAGTFALTLICFTLSTLTTALAIGFAWLGGVRLWLGSAVHRARRLDDWPPTPWCEGKPNRLNSLVLTALVLLLVVGVLTMVVTRPIPNGWAARAGTIALSVCSPVLLVLVRDALHRRVFARDAAECWPEDDSTLASEGAGAIE